MVEQVEVRDVFAENAYFHIDPQTRQGFLIDPGAEPERLYQIIKNNNLDIQAILLTHGHFDHTGAIAFLHGQLGLPYYILPQGQAYLTNPALNLSGEWGRDSILPDAHYFNDGDFISLPGNPDFGLRVISTPGHTPDSATLYSESEGIAFVGDTIFKGSPGLTNFPGGNRTELFESIMNRILTLPNKTVLYSGHTPPTTVGSEKPNYM